MAKLITGYPNIPNRMRKQNFVSLLLTVEEFLYPELILDVHSGHAYYKYGLSSELNQNVCVV